jgi:hypothetical protein
MKSVLLYANPDQGLEARLQAALNVVRHFGGHLTCLQVTPFDSFIMGDPFCGVYALPSLKHVAEAEREHRLKLEERLRGEGASGDRLRYEGTPAQLLVERSRLADLIVLKPSRCARGRRAVDGRRRCSILRRARACGAVRQPPLRSGGHGDRGWNGAQESAHALRLALPILATAIKVEVVTVVEDRMDFPATDACEYLARHNIGSQLHEQASHQSGTSCLR